MFKQICSPKAILIVVLMLGYSMFPSFNSTLAIKKPGKNTPLINAVKQDSYKLWQLDRMGLSEVAFNDAMKGFNYLHKANLIAKTNIVSIVDFSKPSTEKRLYVIDVNSGKVLFNTWVAHGRNSGSEYANQFSNLVDSHQSSLGFYVTMGTYTGENGYSLRLKGCEKGINDKALERAIVMHGADYVSNRFISNRGALGRSYGCPAVPAELNKEIIDVIKNGSCLFLYHPTKKYCSRSKILNSQV